MENRVILEEFRSTYFRHLAVGWTLAGAIGVVAVFVLLAIAIPRATGEQLAFFLLSFALLDVAVMVQTLMRPRGRILADAIVPKRRPVSLALRNKAFIVRLEDIVSVKVVSLGGKEWTRGIVADVRPRGHHDLNVGPHDPDFYRALVGVLEPWLSGGKRPPVPRTAG